jgi:hypothetical protein
MYTIRADHDFCQILQARLKQFDGSVVGEAAHIHSCLNVYGGALSAQ